MVRCEIADPKDELRPGMLASFVIRVQDPVESVAVPVKGVVRNGDGTMAAWVTEDRKRFTQRIIQLGLQKDGRYQVLEGLRPGELVVTEGAVFVSNILNAPPDRLSGSLKAISCSSRSLHSASVAARSWCSAWWPSPAPGSVAFKKLNIEAYPNPTPVILEITAQAPGLSAEEMERYYTRPIEIGLYTTPGIDVIRSTSFYGLSFVRVVFKYGVDYHFAYSQAAIALQQNITLPGRADTPNPTEQLDRGNLSLSGGGPEAFWADQSAHGSGLDCRAPALDHSRHRSINSWGGTTKEFEVEIDPRKLEAYNVTVPQMLTALGNANINVGGREIRIGQQSINIRGVGLIDDGGGDDLTQGFKVDDIENVVLSQTNGVPVLVKDVANVKVGYCAEAWYLRPRPGGRRGGGHRGDEPSGKNRRNAAKSQGGNRQNESPMGACRRESRWFLFMTAAR